MRSIIRIVLAFSGFRVERDPGNRGVCRLKIHSITEDAVNKLIWIIANVLDKFDEIKPSLHDFSYRENLTSDLPKGFSLEMTRQDLNTTARKYMNVSLKMGNIKKYTQDFIFYKKGKKFFCLGGFSFSIFSIFNLK